MKRLLPSALIGLSTLAVVLSLAAPNERSLVERLGAATAAERDAAARELLELGDSALPALEAGATSADPAVRERARAILDLVTNGTDVGSPARRRRATALVREALASPGGLAADGEFAKRLDALAPESGDALADAARTAASRPGTRALVPTALAAALGRHMSPHGLSTLIELVERRSIAPSGALSAARELTAHDLTTRALLEQSGGGLHGRPSADELEAARLRLAAHFDDDSASQRRALAALYAALADADSAGPLVALADDRDAIVRQEVARSLGRLPRLDARELLARLSSDPAEDVRVAALEGLRNESRDAVRDVALRAAQDASAAVRSAAVPLLSGDRSIAARAALARLEVDDSARVRGAVRRARSEQMDSPREPESKERTDPTTVIGSRAAQ